MLSDCGGRGLRPDPPSPTCVNLLVASEHTSSPAIFAFFTTLLVIMDYVRSNKGGMKLLFQSNLYVKQKVLSSGAVCWECDQHRNKFACKAKLHVLDDQVIKQVSDHTHVASRAVVESSKVRQEMKKRARETEETPQQIISQSVALLSEQATVAMPPIHRIRRDIRRQRRRAGNSLPVPQDKDFDIPPEYHQTTSGQ